MRILTMLLAVLGVAGAGSAQPVAPASPRWSPEVGVGVALGHVFRYEDQAFGNVPNASVSIAARHRSGAAVEFEFNRHFGLTPDVAPCGIVNVTCVGIAHDGVRAASSASLNLRYMFRGARVRPYITAGVGALWSRSVWSRTDVHGAEAVQSEREQRDAGIGPDVGVGLRVAITSTTAVAADVRSIEGSSLSSLNLSAARVSLRWMRGW